MIERIAHLTDFSESSATAFAHAMRLALACKSGLYVLHAHAPGHDHEWASFPHVREMLARWGRMTGIEPTSEIEAKTGVRVSKVEIDSGDVTRSLGLFLKTHLPDLIVVATSGREGLARLFQPSQAEEIAQHVRVPTLFIRAGAQGFVDTTTGALRLGKILMPVTSEPSPARALKTLHDVLTPLGVGDDRIAFVHVGQEPPTLQTSAGIAKIELLEGTVEDAILAAATAQKPDLIVMATAGRHGLGESLWGSTTERVIHRAPCPVLAIPVR